MPSPPAISTTIFSGFPAAPPTSPCSASSHTRPDESRTGIARRRSCCIMAVIVRGVSSRPAVAGFRFTMLSIDPSMSRPARMARRISPSVTVPTSVSSSSTIRHIWLPPSSMARMASRMLMPRCPIELRQVTGRSIPRQRYSARPSGLGIASISWAKYPFPEAFRAKIFEGKDLAGRDILGGDEAFSAIAIFGFSDALGILSDAPNAFDACLMPFTISANWSGSSDAL